VEDFLLTLRFPVLEDSMLTSAIEMAIARTLKNAPETTADVVFMSQLRVPRGRGRDLGVLRGNILVGMSPTGATGDDVVYSGDRSVVNESKLTLQLRVIDLSSVSVGESTDVPWIAFYLPADVQHNAWLADD
jgi:hypothetical protein